MDILADIAHKIGFDWRLSITHLINFLIIFLLLVKFALPNLKKVINERNQKIKDGLKNEIKSKEILENAQKEAKDIIVEANHKANKNLSLSEENAKKIIDNANQESGIIKTEALLLKENAKQNGLNEAYTLLEKDLPNIISSLSLQIIGEKIDSKVNNELIKKSFNNNL